MYDLIAYVRGYKYGNVWERGSLAQVARTAQNLFECTEFEIDEMMDGRKVWISNDRFIGSDEDLVPWEPKNPPKGGGVYLAIVARHSRN